MPAGERGEADRSEGRSKWQKEKERGGERTGRRIRQRPTRLTRLARPRIDAYIGVRPSSREIRLEEGTN
jgi:predicted metalloprotease